jgi:hypothetical protein
MSYDPATVRAVCEFLRSHTTWEGKPDVIGAAYAEVIEERFPTESPAPEPSTDTLRGTLERLGTFNECVRIYIQHRDAGRDVRPGWLEEEVFATDALLGRLAATPAREDEDR